MSVRRALVPIMPPASPRRSTPRLSPAAQGSGGSWARWWCVALAALFSSTAALAAPRQLTMNLRDARDNRACLACHGDPAWAQANTPAGRPSLFVDAKAYAASTHAARTCTDCHQEITTVPHGTVEPVRCGRCHPTSSTSSGRVGAATLHEGAHARALRQGKQAPTCARCHGSHDIRGPDDRRSRVHRTSIPTTCGECHSQEAAEYQDSVHGRALAANDTDAAVCIDCHGEHEQLLPTGDPASSAHPSQVPDTCSHCHESLPLTERHGLATLRAATYRESYHGIAARFGDPAAANCASCHGFHDILPSSDPRSRIHRDNLAQTCGECHPGATANFARGTVHLIPTPKEDAPVYWVRLFYRAFIALLMAQFVALIVLDLAAHRRERRRRGGSA